MQTAISRLAFTFTEDAVTLATGAGRIFRDLSITALAAVRTEIMAPIERLAQACDVAGVMAARQSEAMRFRSRGARLENTRMRRRQRFDVFGLVATFRALRDLT